MKCKGVAFLQRSTNSDETFLRGLCARSIAEPDRNILGQDMISPKCTTQSMECYATTQCFSQHGWHCG